MVTKIDLLPHLDLDLELLRTNLRRTNPQAPVLLVSAKTGEGVAAWLDWLRAGIGERRANRPTDPGPTP